MRWQQLAACAGQTNLFFDTDTRDEALGLCSSCPVFAECRAEDDAYLTGGVERWLVFGVMAGRLQQQRRDRVRVYVRPSRPEIAARIHRRPADVTHEDVINDRREMKLAGMAAEWLGEPSALSADGLKKRFSIGRTLAMELRDRLKEAV